MSATTAATSTRSAPYGAAPTPTAIGRIRRGAPPIALVVGSLGTVAGMALHVEGLPDEAFVRSVAAKPDQWLASHVLLGLGMALVALGLTSVLRLVEGRQARAVASGAVIGAIGAALMSLGDLAHGGVAFALAGSVDPATSLSTQEAYFAEPAIMILSMGGMLLPLGLVVLGIGLLRTKVVPLWLGAAVLISPIAIQAGMASGPRMLAFGLPFLVAMGALAREAARA